MEPHQERVVVELKELSDKVTKLKNFISSPIFSKLSYDEQGRLKIQSFLMQEYAAVLQDRIDHFPV